jgi:hypothetical protein
MPSRTKKLEQLFFEQFRSKVSEFPTGSVIHDDAPDFLVSMPHTSLGIEITQIFREVSPGELPEQQYEAEEQLIIDRAQEMATTLQLPPLLVSAYFSSQARPQKRYRDSITRKLVESVESNLPLGDDFAFRLHSNDGLPREIDAVSVRRYPCITKPLWQTGGAGAVMEDCASDIQAKIDSKNAKLGEYKRRCADCWLLIVADWFAASSAFYEPSAKTLEHKFNTAYDRIYFLESFSGRVLRLQTVANN